MKNFQAGGITVDGKHKERISASVYSIEDKNRVDHLDKYASDKYRRDSSRGGERSKGSLMPFNEKRDYVPSITVSDTAFWLTVKWWF